MRRALVLAVVFAAPGAWAADVCSPFDKDPANAGVVGGRLPDGGISPDQPACCDGRPTDDACGPRKCSEHGLRNVGAPVDTLNGFAWLDRTDVDVAQPWGPNVTFTRHYSTAWAQGAGSTTEVGALGPGWSHTWASRLVFASSGLPPSRVVLRHADAGSEEYNLYGGQYVSRHASRTLTWDATTQLFTALRPDGGALVFDAQGRLVVLRSSDGAEAQLRYAGADAACAPSPTLPAGQLCRVDFLFNRQLWFRYDAVGHLTAVAWAPDFASPIVTLGYAGAQLTTATGADGAAETYA